MTRSWKEITHARPDSPERRAAYERSRDDAVTEIVAYSLGELRKMRSITQVELARRLSIAQPSLSGLEKRGDCQLSTLRNYVEGLGGRLEISAVFDDTEIPIDVILGDSGAND